MMTVGKDREGNTEEREVNNQYFSCTENKLRCCGIVIHTNRRKQFEKCTRFREARPEKMFLTLQKHGHKIEEKYPGIYYVTEHLPFPAQVIVTQELEPGEHRSLRILSNHAKKEDVEEFLREAEGMNTPRDRQNVEAVLQVSVKANDELYRKIRRDANMCDALRELMKDDLEDARKLGESEGEVRGEAKIILKMNHSGMSPENIASITGKDLDEINAILEGKVPVLL